MNDLIARLFVLLQQLLPKSLLTTFVYHVARVRWGPLKNFLIRRFVALYDVDTSKLLHSVPEGYPNFNHFFIRELSPGARTIDSGTNTIISPVDGTVSARGQIEDDDIFQAKGLHYSLTDLLATDTDEATIYRGGSFITLYLAPYNYHRVHAPLTGEIKSAHYIPGTLFSVNDSTVRCLPMLFARNERVACHVQTASGPMVILFVGAINVGTIYTKWTGDVRPRHKGIAEDINLSGSGRSFDKGETIGWFNLGSTVILLLPPDTSNQFVGISAGDTVSMGQAIGTLRDSR